MYTMSRNENLKSYSEVCYVSHHPILKTKYLLIPFDILFADPTLSSNY